MGAVLIAILNNPAFIDFASGMARHLLTAVGGMLVAKGLLSTGSIDQMVGGGMALLGTLWSAWSKVLK